MAYPKEVQVDAIVNNARMPNLITIFFDEATAFEGNLLERIGENHPTSVTIDDLLAITMLDVSVNPRGIRRLVYDADVSKKITAFLEDIPLNVDIWNAPKGVLGSDGSAQGLWRYLKKPGTRVSEVTAGKLLARKRPQLIPIVDSVIKGVIQVEPADEWDFFASYLSQPLRRQKLATLMPSDLDPKVSILRLLDVALWMCGSQSKAAKNARRKAGFEN